jgi:hypothetical protein
MLYFLELLNVEEHAQQQVSSGEHQIILVRLVWLPVEIARELELMIV